MIARAFLLGALAGGAFLAGFVLGITVDDKDRARGFAADPSA